MRRRLALAAAAAAALALTAPASDAAPGETTLYFGNVAEGATEGCTPEYQLLLVQVDGGECSGTILAANGVGVFSDMSYPMEKKRSLKIDAGRNVKGTIYVQHFPVIFFNAAPKSSLPGYVDLDVDVRIDGKSVGIVTAKGVATPTNGLTVPVDLDIPASLNNKKTSKVEARVTWRTATGLSGISHSEPAASHLVIPVK